MTYLRVNDGTSPGDFVRRRKAVNKHLFPRLNISVKDSAASSKINVASYQAGGCCAGIVKRDNGSMSVKLGELENIWNVLGKKCYCFLGYCCSHFRRFGCSAHVYCYMLFFSYDLFRGCFNCFTVFCQPNVFEHPCA